MSDPVRTGDPEHMKNYLNTRADNGGVHTNSNIHNKAAYNLFIVKDANSNYTFTPREAATLYYLALTRLSRTADFSATRQALKDVARTYYAGDPNELSLKLAAIDDSYDKVGIP
jgi:Zn-dependent metalloprotease